ncbi:APC family permease [Eggerthella sp. YY7918]|uniref:APC family permease n=1 Tax=Eggerthella sp. (strain YY7918) TaxID=502558 RepID=UPI000217187E|nr:APC family permease [Eggerthella sp. YY7918]BAK44038.1 amino acid transporter [Eggerthella sp. YY7918]
MGEKVKKFSFISVILSVICVVFVAEAAAPAAAIGNQQFFWWIFLIITFLLPYGMVVAELGTTYDSDGGLYDWIREAFGDRWGSRVAWYYWINFPLWIASLATLFPDILGMVFGVEFDLIVVLLIELAFVWIVVLMSFSKVSDSAWILNGGAVLKVLIAVSVGVLGIWFAMSNGFASNMAPETFLPDITNTNALTYLSIILFNFMGFEVICTFAGAMKNPSKDIPKAIILGGLAIAAIYLFCSFGIGAAIPADQIDPDFGMIFAVATMVGEASPIFMIICIVFLVTLFANMASWSFGVNFVADYAAKHGNMPKVFSHENAKTEMPTGAAIVNGVVASLALMLQLIPIPAISEGIFWMLFSMNVVFLLISYIPMFSAFLKLRKVDPDRPRVFKFPFKGKLMYVMLAIPAIELVLAIIATIVPLNGTEEELSKIPMLIGVIVFIVLGEIIRIYSARGRKEEYKGLTPEMATQRLAEEAAEEAAEGEAAPAVAAADEAEPQPVA